MHMLSVAMEPILHKSCPPNCQDMLAWLPYHVALRVLSFLDSGTYSYYIYSGGCLGAKYMPCSWQRQERDPNIKFWKFKFNIKGRQLLSTRVALWQYIHNLQFTF